MKINVSYKLILLKLTQNNIEDLAEPTLSIKVNVSLGVKSSAEDSATEGKQLSISKITEPPLNDTKESVSVNSSIIGLAKPNMISNNQVPSVVKIVADGRSSEVPGTNSDGSSMNMNTVYEKSVNQECNFSTLKSKQFDQQTDHPEIVLSNGKRTGLLQSNVEHFSESSLHMKEDVFSSVKS